MMANFEFFERDLHFAVVLDLKGRIIYGEGSNELHSLFRRLVEQGVKEILLNFSEVKSIDSSGFGELVGGCVAARRISGDVKIFNLAPNVLSLFQLTRLDSVFEIYDNEAAAIASCQEYSTKSAHINS